MADPDLEHYQAVTLLLVNDALEAHGRKREPAVGHLIDAAATLIVDAHRKVGLDAADMTRHFAKYLIERVLAHSGDVE